VRKPGLFLAGKASKGERGGVNKKVSAKETQSEGRGREILGHTKGEGRERFAQTCWKKSWDQKKKGLFPREWDYMVGRRPVGCGTRLGAGEDGTAGRSKWGNRSGLKTRERRALGGASKRTQSEVEWSGENKRLMSEEEGGKGML